MNAAHLIPEFNIRELVAYLDRPNVSCEYREAEPGPSDRVTVLRFTVTAKRRVFTCETGHIYTTGGGHPAAHTVCRRCGRPYGSGEAQ